ncbi:response regulator transcription factor [Sphingobacterium sp. lm-10]|uniref:response regulator n=1 Tax=Sphingobacterium sp. lm-10 TaxID=2944904 RepID=UPI0020221C5E|nr:response regulator transcription factor [Sphingobacterium sp. lm-10]MCL7986962.1 response regulator transcription factor [Sphingobacterium sp. lm-10]
MVRIILADDHRVVRNGIRLLLETQPDINIIAEATSGEEVLALLNDNSDVDILLTDMNMNGISGPELMQSVSNDFPHIKVVFLSMIDNELEVKEVMNLGAKAYLLKNADYDELLFAISHVGKGGQYLSSEISMRLLQSIGSVSQKSQPETVLRDLDLSSREYDVLQLLVNGFTTKDIAEKLFISKRTVEGHRQKLLDKTTSKNYVELIKFAINHQLID